MRHCVFLLGLVGLAAAQPHRRGHRHHMHPVKRDVEFVTETDVITSVQEVVVWVDENGEVISGPAGSPSTVTASSEVSTVQPAQSIPLTASVTPSAYVSPPAAAYAPAPPAYQPTTIAAQPTTQTITTASSSTSESGVPRVPPERDYGVSYSPYNPDSSCKTYDQVDADINKLQIFGYIRSYGTDCNQAYNILKAAKKYKLKVMLGIYDLTSIPAEVQLIINAVNSLNDNWASVKTVNVGNEHVNSGRATVGAVVDATNSARTQLRAAGYDGPVVTVDTFNAIIENPELCGASDYAAANCHAFFDPNTDAADAGAFVSKMADQVSSACGGKNVTITETGWPSQGGRNGDAIPGVQNQQVAITSLTDHFDSDLILFSAFNDEWKVDNPSTFGCEKFWGLPLNNITEIVGTRK